MRHFLLLVLLQNIGCSTQEPTFWYTGSDQGYFQAVEAAEDWNRVCGTRFQVTIDHGIPLVERPEGTFLGQGIESPTAAGKTVMNGSKTVRVEFVHSPNGAEVMRHELGHVLVLDHTDHGIMQLASKRSAKDRVISPLDCP